MEENRTKKTMNQAITSTQLTPKQNQFINYLVVEGLHQTESARRAGYSYPGQTSYHLIKNPKIIRAIRQARQTYYQGELASLAVGTLRQVMQDTDAPAAARVQASRTVLELAGDLNKGKGDDLSSRSLAEMTPDELGSIIDKWESERVNLAKDITPSDLKSQNDGPGQAGQGSE